MVVVEGAIVVVEGAVDAEAVVDVAVGWLAGVGGFAAAEDEAEGSVAAPGAKEQATTKNRPTTLSRIGIPLEGRQ